MFDDLAAGIEAEEVHGDVLIVSGPRLVRVLRDQIALGQRTHEADGLARVLRVHRTRATETLSMSLGLISELTALVK